MFARGEFDLGATPALTVPQAAVVVRDGFSYVYRVNPDNRVSQVKVQTGRWPATAGDRRRAGRRTRASSPPAPAS